MEPVLIMTPASMFCTPNALADLGARTEYETWLLEAVYEIIDQRLAVEKVDELVYPPNGGLPRQTKYLSAHMTIGDWRRGFLQAGAPLVFVTGFKLLDMLIEWVLAQNCKRPTHRFEEKREALKGSVQFPALIETRTWLRERLIALYKELEPLRGTIVHARHFKTASGTLQVSSSKGGKVGPIVTIADGDLRNLALVLVSLLRYLQGTWAMDLFQEKRLRRALDELTHLHRLSPLGQLPPSLLRVRLYVPDEDPIGFDITRVRRDVAEKRKGEDVVFDINIIAVALDGTGARAYVVPWDQLQDTGPQFRKARADLATYAVPLPADVDSDTAAREMRNSGDTYLNFSRSSLR